MYFCKYGKEYLHDPREGLLLDDAEVELEVNASGSFSFTVHSTHPLFDSLSKRDTARPVTIYHDDTLVFYGDITEIEQDFHLSKKCVCRGALGWLNDTLIRPYSTLEGECDNIAPSSVDGFFEWLIDQHNSQVEQTKTFKVGKNEGSLLDKNNYLYRSDSKYPNTGSVIAEKVIDSLGGYIQFRYEDGIRYVDLLTDFPTVNAQIIDFGVNLLDYANTDVTDDMATFVVPVGSTISNEEESSNKAVEQRVTISSLTDGVISDGYCKTGDIIYSEEAVKKYGWIGAVVEFNDITDPNNLLESGLIALKEMRSPIQTVELTAVDLAMIDPTHKPIYIGQYVRARAKPHNFDSFMLCSALKLNLNQPDNNKITLGHTFSKLTGVQNKRINALNATVNTVYESASLISAESKATAIVASQAREQAERAEQSVSEAVTKAENAAQAAGAVAEKADKAEQDAQAAKDMAEEATAQVTLAQTAITEAKQAASQAGSKATEAKEAADKAQDDVDALAVRVTTAETKITQNSEAIELRATKTEVTETLGGYYTKEEADAAITVSADSITSTVASTYTTKEEFDNLKVGGRNLLLNSNELVDPTSEYLIKRYALSEDWVKNCEYTVTIKGSISEGQAFGIWLSESASPLGLLVYDQDKDLYVLTFMEFLDVTSEWERNLSVFNVPNPSSTGNTATIEWIKLERGNKATDWTPAPEDMATEADLTAAESRITQTVEGITSSVTALDGRVSTVEQTAGGLEVRLGTAEDDIESAKSTASKAKETAESIVQLVITTSRSTTLRSPDETVTATANVFRKGAKLTDEEVAELGTVRWYLNGNEVAEGMTYSINACNGTLKARLEV